jgi:hypothetical protein
MTRRRIVLLVAAVLLALPSVAAKQHKLVEDWTNSDFKRRSFGKIVIVAITDDAEARKHFENKFVSHLRGRGVEASVSYGIAPDLAVPPSRGQVLEFIADEGVDAAISVRVVPLKDRGEAEWGAAWSEGVHGNGTLAQLIEASLPVTGTKAPGYGVEVSLWDTDNRLRIWSGRTNSYTRKQMRKGAGTFVQFVIDALRNEGLL